MSRLRRRPSPALAVACIALAVALGGTGYAAVSLPANSVGTKQLKNGAVVGAKVKPHSLLRSSFMSGQIPQGPAGPQGLSGAAGPKGDKGDKGDRGDKGDSAPRVFAAVKQNADGSAGIGAHNGFDTSVGHNKGSSQYTLTTPNQSLANCAVLAAPSGKDNGGDFVDGEVTAAITGDKTVTVQTFDSDGGEQEQDFFTVAVFC
jgi:hypothetical protein